MAVYAPPPSMVGGGLIIGVVATAFAVLAGVTGARTFRRQVEPVSFSESFVVGIVAGVAVFLLYTFGRWPYPDIWGRHRRGQG